MEPHEGYRCIGCGACLNVCPDYQLRRSEVSSPRGRIYITLACHRSGAPVPCDLYAPCENCDICVSACPAGVRLDKIFHSLDDSSSKGINNEGCH